MIYKAPSSPFYDSTIASATKLEEQGPSEINKASLGETPPH